MTTQSDNEMSGYAPASMRDRGRRERSFWGLVLLIVLVLAIARFLCGCETADRARDAVDDLIDDARPVPTTSTTTTTIPPVPPQAGNKPLQGFAWRWGGFNGSRAQLDPSVTVSAASIRGGTLRLSYSSNAHWPQRQVGHAVVASIVCLFVEDGAGGWRGGKFEWARANQGSVGLRNIHDGYNGWPVPASGTRLRVALVSVDGRRCSAPVDAGVWP